jgi:hypothetical protein
VPKKQRRGRLVDVTHRLGVLALAASRFCRFQANFALGLFLLGLCKGLLDRVGGGSVVRDFGWA